MSAQTLRQRHIISAARTRTHATTAEREWRAAPRTILPPVAPAPATAPTLGDRISEAFWHAHDTMPNVWALLGTVVLLGMGSLAVGLAAVCLGWRP